MKNHLKALLLVIFMSGCQEPNKKEEMENIIQNQIKGGMLLRQFYSNHVPKLVYQINDQGLKEGYSFSYQKDGALATITSWKNGQKSGEEIIFYPSGEVEEINSYQKGKLEGNSHHYKNGFLTAHHIYRQGKKWYEGIYTGQEKYMDKLYPQIIEEFFFEDKYYAKIRFPMSHKGQINLKVKESGTPVIQQLDKGTFQVVINDALDLDKFKLELEYLPAPSDTLVPTQYSYTHQIYNTE